jgi:hypothetical protein
MTVKAKKAKKIQFRIGARLVDAPFQSGTLEQNVTALMPNFPILRMTTVLESDGQVLPNGNLEYNVFIPAKTNG